VIENYNLRERATKLEIFMEITKPGEKYLTPLTPSPQGEGEIALSW